jgi:hypothetical protein
MREERIIEQVDKLVASGRITEDEAAQLRASEGTPEFDAAVGAIRASGPDTPGHRWREPSPMER